MYQLVSSTSTHGGHVHRGRNGINWRIPSLMVASFLAGGIFILGHHLFYQSLHHQATSNALFQQQVNIGIGTAFAFIVKMFLVIAVSTGYWQVFWLHMKRHAVPVERIDAMNDILENALQFLRLKTLGRFPLLGFIAAITWLLPLAAVVPPAALTIELSPVPVETQQQMNIPVLNFNTGEYAQIAQGGSGAGQSKNFDGARYKVSRISSAAAFSGRLQQFSRPAANSTFAVTFHGPALQCQNLADDLAATFTTNISHILGCDITEKYPGDNKGLPACFVQPMYMAWAPNETNTVAFSGATGQSQESPWIANTIGPSGSAEPAQFYVASQPKIEGGGNWTYVGCQLYNATYHLNATFTSGNQLINITQRDIAEGVSYITTLDIIGSASANGTDPLSGEEAYVFTNLEHFGYQSLMDMFGHLIAGQITIYSRNAAGSFNFSTSSTSVMQTALADTVELRPIFELAQTCNNGVTNCLSDNTTNKNLNITAPKNGTRLPQALEELFQNMTLSLFSDDVFLTKKADSPQVNVILRSPQNRYVYTAWRLVVPYMVGLGLSAVGLAFGFWALLVNGVSYSQSFSTIVRTTRYAHMDSEIQAKDVVGADPTPTYIKKAKINLSSIRENLEMKGSHHRDDALSE
ncbi:uncharacterized protein PV09_05721 [Verruconis gallopava]|uniref:Uncharacterized protein n=1 Tax=Verruconis gallopava TaxID=253628 RepID=A0A0D2A956_9PEZI|nr:uncharacterized protein PV09_05721 [Verruconis gallopava]KIW03075.1 hypothetical protein PV09_05721 [Verruconis gallopava]